MNYIDKINIAAQGKYYVFSKEQFEKLIRNYVKHETGLDLKLDIEVNDNRLDVFVDWKYQDLEVVEAYEVYLSKHEDPLRLYVLQGYDNQLRILSRIFGTDYVSSSYSEEFNSCTVYVDYDGRE